MEFILGCNYWASNAGTEMWKEWSPDAIEEDLKILSSNGVTHMRVFPNWRDFQPIVPMMSNWGKVEEYRVNGELPPENRYYLDETMLARFAVFCDLCDRYEIKLIVGLLTGYMSGRLFIPSGLLGKNLFTDPTALLFEQRFVTGFVRRFRDRQTVYAWDLGNECNSMYICPDRDAAANWTCIISNAIRASDSTRPIVSGMHELNVEDRGWSIGDQGEYTDLLTTHPYPFWIQHADKDEICRFRTLIHATAQTKVYGDIGCKPCMVEEIGTMGPMICSDELAGDFFRCNAFSNLANGATGIMWWCANEQTNLKTAPYTWNMCEVELGMIDAFRHPKPVLREMRRFREFIRDSSLKFAKPKEDAVCILTQDQDQLGVAYMAYGLAKQSNIHLRFAYGNHQIPEAEIYMLPSITGHHVMCAENYHLLRERVYQGASLYISNDDGFLSQFQSLTGLKILDSSRGHRQDSFLLGRECISFTRDRCYRILPRGAQVLACDGDGIPVVTQYQYGKGNVFYVNAPLEKMLLEESDAFAGNRYRVYEEFFAENIAQKQVISTEPFVAVTEHETDDGTFCIAVNYSPDTAVSALELRGCAIGDVLYGDPNRIGPFDAAVFLLR